jgi:phage-related protein
VWSAVKVIFEPVANFFKTIFSTAWTGIKTTWSGVSTFFSGLWSTIKQIFSAVGTFFKQIFSTAWTAIKNVFSPVVTFFTGVWNSIKGIFDKVGIAIGDGISGAVKAAVNSVLNFATKSINTFLKAINGAISILNKLPGVSISKISEMSVPTLATGGVLERGQVGLLEGDGAEAVVPLEQNTGWINKVASQMAEATAVRGSDSEVLNKILDVLETLNAQMYNYVVNALVYGVRLRMDNREFGRLVKTYA